MTASIDGDNGVGASHAYAEKRSLSCYREAKKRGRPGKSKKGALVTSVLPHGSCVAVTARGTVLLANVAMAEQDAGEWCLYLRSSQTDSELI